MRAHPLPEWTNKGEVMIGMMYLHLVAKEYKNYAILCLLAKHKLQLRQQFCNFHQTFTDLIFVIQPNTLRAQLTKMEKDFVKYGLNWIAGRLVSDFFWVKKTFEFL